LLGQVAQRVEGEGEVLDGGAGAGLDGRDAAGIGIVGAGGWSAKSTLTLFLPYFSRARTFKAKTSLNNTSTRLENTFVLLARSRSCPWVIV
jgi:hypothetical protein